MHSALIFCIFTIPSFLYRESSKSAKEGLRPWAQDLAPLAAKTLRTYLRVPFHLASCTIAATFVFHFSRLLPFEQTPNAAEYSILTSLSRHWSCIFMQIRQLRKRMKTAAPKYPL